jgi:Fur family ferric uptake transcriptional regulator
MKTKTDKLKANDILKHNRLSITEGRKRILELFLSQEGALAHADIENGTEEKFDRVTVYRTLQVFLDKGIIHTIPTADNAIKYALCKDNCGHGHHHDNHIHFVCLSCGNTTCLDDTHIPEMKLPTGYQMQHVDVVVNGWCKICSA